MEDFLKMDIFFVVTTAVVFGVGTFFMVGLYYVVRILRSVDHISENISHESDSVRQDVALLREKISTEGVRFRHFLEFFEKVFKKSETRQKRHHTKDET